MNHPQIIQGGMGVGVSDWRLARAVAQEGALGVVSGTALDTVLVRRLHQGDPGGDVRRALAAFPDAQLAQAILTRYFKEHNTPASHDFPTTPMAAILPEGRLQQHLEELLVVGGFMEVFLAKEGHSGQIGMNLLEKIQVSNPATIYGAMLAGLDYLMMGAGIPVEIPGLLDQYAAGADGSLSLTIEGDPKGVVTALNFSPHRIIANPPSSLKRPAFFAIVSSNVLARTMVTRATGRVDGIVVEDHTAGGHNAPPRGELQLTETGEPIYGVKDGVDPEGIVKLGVPFWLGGSRSFPDSLSVARALGAAGTQVGTLFAFCRESGFLPELKRKFLEMVQAGTARVFTHLNASPTGYPLKIALVDGTVAVSPDFEERPRRCNIGLLRRLYRTADGKIGGRCPAESAEDFVKKGGAPEEASQARCLCNGLLASIGFGTQYSDGYEEKPLLVPGESIPALQAIVAALGLDFSAAQVVRYLQSIT